MGNNRMSPSQSSLSNLLDLLKRKLRPKRKKIKKRPTRRRLNNSRSNKRRKRERRRKPRISRKRKRKRRRRSKNLPRRKSSRKRRRRKRRKRPRSTRPLSRPNMDLPASWTRSKSSTKEVKENLMLTTASMVIPLPESSSGFTSNGRIPMVRSKIKPFGKTSHGTKSPFPTTSSSIESESIRLEYLH